MPTPSRPSAALDASPACPAGNGIVVAHIVTGLNVGGLERVVVNLVRKFRGTVFRPLVICLEEGGAFADELVALNVPVVIMGKRPGRDWGAIRRLARLFRAHGVRIVHTHNPAPHFHGVMAALLARVPIRIHTKHGRNYPHMRGRVLLYRVLSWFTDAVVPVSDNARDVALLVEKMNPDKVLRIWNGVDTEQYSPEVRAESDETPPSATQKSEVRSQIIGTVARLSPEKDLKTLLAAFKIVLEQTADSVKLPRLAVIGDGPCRAELEADALHLGIAGQVDFLGMRSDIPAQLSTFDIFTLSSTTEGISMTILEAMACGVPVVATDVGGNREIVRPPECGLIVPARDARALADAYLELLRNPSLRAQMGAAAHARALAHFSLDKMIEQYGSLYRRLLQTKLHVTTPSSQPA